MLLTAYTEQLCNLLGVTKLPIEEAIARGGRWVNS
jgi:hypothetical protein